MIAIIVKRKMGRGNLKQRCPALRSVIGVGKGVTAFPLIDRIAFI
jgi:hypothetical protein